MITDAARLAAALDRLFWGALIVVLDLRIQNVDLILDPVGAWIILVALNEVSASLGEHAAPRAQAALVPLGAVAFFSSVVGAFAPVVDERVTSTVQAAGTLALAMVLVAVFEATGLDERARAWGQVRVLLIVVLAGDVLGLLVFRGRAQHIDVTGSPAALPVMLGVLLALVGAVFVLVELRRTAKQLATLGYQPITEDERWPVGPA